MLNVTTKFSVGSCEDEYADLQFDPRIYLWVRSTNVKINLLAQLFQTNYVHDSFSTLLTVRPWP